MWSLSDIVWVDELSCSVEHYSEFRVSLSHTWPHYYKILNKLSEISFKGIEIIKWGKVYEINTLEVIKMIKNLPRFIKYTKDKQNHQKWVEKNWHKLFLLKQNWTTPFQPLPFPPLSWWWGRKTGSHIGTLLPAAPPAPPSTAAFSFHPGSKVTS